MFKENEIICSDVEIHCNDPFVGLSAIKVVQSGIEALRSVWIVVDWWAPGSGQDTRFFLRI